MTGFARQADTIDVVGARTNNLRDVTLSIPKGQVVAFTGVSGSGKTSLAIDTIHSEAQLRYLEGLSPFVRQYITRRNRPKVDRILGLGATLAVDQRRLNRNPRSTVATITGIDGHLGLLYSRLPGIGPDATRLPGHRGSGKSSLLGVLGAGVEAALNGAAEAARGRGRLAGLRSHYGRATPITDRGLGGTPTRISRVKLGERYVAVIEETPSEPGVGVGELTGSVVVSSA